MQDARDQPAATRPRAGRRRRRRRRRARELPGPASSIDQDGRLLETLQDGPGLCTAATSVLLGRSAQMLQLAQKLTE